MFAGGGPTLEIAGLTLGVREGVIGLIVLVAFYMAFELLRMRRLKAKARLVSKESESSQAPSLVDEDDELPRPSRRDALAVDNEPAWEPPPPVAANSMQHQALAQEVTQLREELDAIRGELAGLRADMQQEIAHMRASQTISPIYGDAMQMAMSGYDSSMIAERCGIARAEAELVVALAKSQNT